MPAWKFTDVYGSSYPALDNSILSVLVFDVPADTSPISGDQFSASLDLLATGRSMLVLKAILGMNSVPFAGTVTSANGVLSVALKSTNNAAILAALAAFPLIGQQMRSAVLDIQNKTTASDDPSDDLELDRFNINIGIAIGSGSGNLSLQVPMSAGLCAINGEFENFGISFADLNFLVPGANFSAMFPTDLPTSYYNPGTTALNLLALGLTLGVKITPSLSFSVANVSTSIGIVNIPLMPNALYLNPLAVQISISNPISEPVPTWGLIGDICLYPYDKQTSPPSAPPDFTYELAAQMPTSDNPEFEVSGSFENPKDLPVSQILCDLTSNGAFNTGISDQLILEQFDFASQANSTTGTINSFTVEVAMSAVKTNGRYFGLFSNDFGVKDFSIAVSYEK